MSKLTFNLPGIPQHVGIRGKGESPCFSCDADYQYYLNCLQRSAAAFKCQIHAYVLMPDHIHLVVTPDVEFGVPNMMQSVERRYARYIENTCQRTEPLWEKRYKSSLIDSRSYLFACMCYVEVNPVRSKIVNVPSEYKWSSYRANAYNDGAIKVRHHPMFTALGNDDELRSKAYLRLFCSRVEVGSVHTIRNALHQELILGTSEFKESIQQLIERNEQVSRAEKLMMKKQAA